MSILMTLVLVSGICLQNHQCTMVQHHHTAVVGKVDGWVGRVVPNGRQLFLDYTPNGPTQEPDQDDVVNFLKQANVSAVLYLHLRCSCFFKEIVLSLLYSVLVWL